MVLAGGRLPAGRRDRRGTSYTYEQLDALPVEAFGGVTFWNGIDDYIEDEYTTCADFCLASEYC